MNKDKIDLELEAIQISIYVDIIQLLLQSHNGLSVTKTMFFSYIIKKQELHSYKELYNGRHTRDLTVKAISLIEGDLEGYQRSIIYIVKSIDLLIGNKIISLTNNILYIDKSTANNLVKESTFFRKAIEESQKKSDRQFWREVIESV